MAIVGLLPALTLIAGVLAALRSDLAAPPWGPAVAWLAAAAAWRASWNRATVILLSAGFAAAGSALAAGAAREALRPSLRQLLDAEFGGFAIDTLGPGGDHDPVPAVIQLEDDATRQEDQEEAVVTLRGRVRAIELGGAWQPVDGGVFISVGGSLADAHAGEWRAGRTVEAPVAFRRPGRYLNDGVRDFEQDLALGGTTLFGSTKSALQVRVVSKGSVMAEAAAAARAHVRRACGRWIAPHAPLSAGLTTAVLIGDRTGLPDEVRDRLQAAGTYHVVAISGGNIAILGALLAAVAAAAGVRGRAAALVTAIGLLLYAEIVATGPSVWRATLMAVLYLAARLLDHRTPAWQAIAAAAALLLCANPLDLRSPGFVLTFGATAALVQGVPRGSGASRRHRAVRWIGASLGASAAAEVALLPASASFFSRVTAAGLLLNLLAVPLMSLVQVAGLAVSLLDWIPPVAGVAGHAAHLAAAGLVGSARLVDAAPWLTARVPAPPAGVVVIYYAGLLAAVLGPPPSRGTACAVTAAAGLAIILGLNPGAGGSRGGEGRLRLTVFDVGQSEALLLEADGRPLLVDAGGVAFGRGSFDVGERVVTPGIWARGVRRLEALVVTHGDPDHLGGAGRVLRDLAPSWLGTGIEVPSHEPSRRLLREASARGVRVLPLRRGAVFEVGRARIRVLHPPEPDWERRRVRNDDSVVMEVRYGDVALLLTGDIGGEVEQEILPLLTPAKVRVLKVAHHGSRTSTSERFVERWRPHYALVSAGRGNTFGHPAREVLARLDAVGAAVLRTDRHGQITIETDGRRVQVRTFPGASPSSIRPPSPRSSLR